MVLQSYIRKDS